MSGHVEIAAIDGATATEVETALAPLFEGAPAFLGRLAAARPFGSWARLFEEARRIAHAMPQPEQVELIDAHPRLGAAPASVSAMSFREQGYDRVGEHLTLGEAQTELEANPRRDVRTELDRLNVAYEARFGFRYCVFVAGRPREALLPEMEVALVADHHAELHRALDAVVDIAQDRHRTLDAAAARADGSASPAGRTPASPRSAT